MGPTGVCVAAAPVVGVVPPHAASIKPPDAAADSTRNSRRFRSRTVIRLILCLPLFLFSRTWQHQAGVRHPAQIDLGAGRDPGIAAVESYVLPSNHDLTAVIEADAIFRLVAEEDAGHHPAARDVEPGWWRRVDRDLLWADSDGDERAGSGPNPACTPDPERLGGFHEYAVAFLL